jgi:hypothetical protein
VTADGTGGKDRPYVLRKATFAPPWAKSPRWKKPTHMVDPNDALRVMLEARKLNGLAGPRSEFVDDVIAYFRSRGSVTSKQYQAIKNWCAQEAAKIAFLGVEIPAEEPPTQSRFANLVEEEDDESP